MPPLPASTGSVRERADAVAAEDLRRDGFAVVRSLLPTRLLDDVLEAYARDVLAHPGSLMRQNERRETNVIGPGGGLVNGLAEIHREEAPALRAYRRRVEAVVRHPAIARLMRLRFGRPCRAVHVLCLDESKNGPHQDHAYEDSVPPGELAGVFVPLWDCRGPANNRFFVVPGSQGRVVPHDAESLRTNTYIRDVYAAVAEHHGGRLLPLDLARGDAVLFGATMIHGSVLGESGRLPRIVAHYLPEDATYRARRLDAPVAVRAYGLPLHGTAVA